MTHSRPLPREGSTASPEALELASRQFENGGIQGHCGPYRLLSDVEDPAILGACGRIAMDLDAVYEARFAVAATGSPRATILLFRDRDGYQAFAAEEGMPSAGYAGYSMPHRGYMAVWADASRSSEFAKTLAHELTHLVNRRALGGGLPRWLSEGLADAIGDTASTEGIQPLIGIAGSEGVAERLRLALEAGNLESVSRLVELDDDDFDRATVSYDYEQSALLVRYLLTDPELAPLFRRFLADIASGAVYSSDLLQSHLGLEWEELDRRLAVWLAG